MIIFNLFYFSVQLCRALSENKNHDVGFRGKLCVLLVLVK